MNFNRLPKKERELIFKQIHEVVSISPASIEKDWWVVQTLKLVFQMEAAPHLVFKGGTSLSNLFNWRLGR